MDGELHTARSLRILCYTSWRIQQSRDDDVTQPPVSFGNPLAHTTGIASQLKSLCCKGSWWRDLADALGIPICDQRDIEARSQGNDIHHLLVDRLVDIHGDRANILTLVLALLKLGQQGKEVLTKMVEGQLLQSLEDMEMAERNPWVDEDKRSENTRDFEIPSTTAEDAGAARNHGFDALLGRAGSATPRNPGSARIADSTENRLISLSILTKPETCIACTKESVIIPLERAGQTPEGILLPATDKQGSVSTQQAAPKKKEDRPQSLKIPDLRLIVEQKIGRKVAYFARYPF